ncbi:MAG: site-specific integrase, partial [Bacillota bacterium]
MERAIKDFLNFLAVEKGLAHNTLLSYRSDLNFFRSFCQKKDYNFLGEGGRTAVAAYLLHLKKEGRSAATVSRRLAAIKSLYRFLINDGQLETDPTENLESPKKIQKLPRVLTTDEVDRLLSQPRTMSPPGLRDKAML